MYPNTLVLIFVILVSTVLLALAIYLLSNYNRLFAGVKNIWLRRNLAVLSVAILGMSALLALGSQEMAVTAKTKGWLGIILK